VVVPIALVTWLLVDVPRRDPELFHTLRNQPKNWVALSGGVLMVLVATLIAFYRWMLLVRGLGLPFRLADALRLGFLGYILNFVALGHSGGDLFKAVFIAREQPGRRIEAVSTVVIDRILGLFGLLLVASGALWLFQPTGTPLRALGQGVRLLTVMVAVVGLVVLLPDFSRSVFVRRLFQARLVGPLLQRLVAAVTAYRQRKSLLLVAAGLSIGVHLLIGIALWCGSIGLFPQTPTLVEHQIISPLANVAGALPVAPAGLGTFEYAMAALYEYIPRHHGGMGRGLAVALCYRIMTLAIAVIGVVYYLWNRPLVEQLTHDAERTSR
jgi:uncharacterized protein (TIRG00374 family)